MIDLASAAAPPARYTVSSRFHHGLGIKIQYRAQMFNAAPNTDREPIIGKPMDKRGEIPGSKKKERTFANAAPKEDVEKLRDEIESAGLKWHDAIIKAGLSRNLGYTLLRGEGSVGSLRDIQEWWSKAQHEIRPKTARTAREMWAHLADELEALGPDELGNTIEGLEEYIRAEKRRRAALRKMFRVTPGSDV